ncbi:UDP-glucose dehydrogenase family protein [Pseudalkalibacillus sp. Hm43]|uniref:UDP-glucose dehydrogenase family protein n=1 Tax=Pseudalkalibacillus sp. Hm43 TaxID=3450742 RepID=UPI003F4335F7
MNVCIIGSGYVGLTTGAVLAQLGHHVTCVDLDQNKVKTLNDGKVPIYEPGLEELIQENAKKGTLSFTTEVQKAIQQNEIIMIAVGTPLRPDQTTDLSYVESVIEDLANSINSYKIIITKSTVPVGTNEWMNRTLIQKGVRPDLFDLVSNPEFLKEGTAIKDMLNPDKIVVGTTNEKMVDTVKQLYKGLDTLYIVTNLNGAELIKYASNAFLATKISFINELARISDAFDVDIKTISKALGTDPRIGPHFLNAGIGYGGSCFPKDLTTLTFSAISKQVVPYLLHAVQKVNDTQVDYYLEKLQDSIPDLSTARIALWGLAFKPGTDDTRHSPAIRLLERLSEHKCEVQGYDPVAVLNHPSFRQLDDLYESVKNCDALILVTEWEEFHQNVDWNKVKQNMKGSVILDGRNVLDPEVAHQYGFQYLGVGRH